MIGELGQDIKNYLDRVQAKINLYTEVPEDWVQQPLKELFRHPGKMLRPSLAYVVQDALGEIADDTDTIGACIEMVHVASLIHDDVIDEAQLRRGYPTFNQSFGNKKTVLLGDHLLCQALLGIASLGNIAQLQTLSQAVADMTSAQILEDHAQGNPHLSLATYRDIIQGKTAALIVACCTIAAQGVTSNPALIKPIIEYSNHLGTAFQIQDDWLDYWGESQKLGKKTLQDLAEHRPTYPFVLGMSSLSEVEQNKLVQLFAQSKELTARHAIRDLLHQTGIDTLTHHHVKVEIDQAQQSLKKLPQEIDTRHLSEILEAVLSRKA